MAELKKMITAGSILATTAQATPIVRFFELTTDPKRQKRTFIYRKNKRTKDNISRSCSFSRKE